MNQRFSLKTICFNLAALLCASLLFNSLSSVSYADAERVTAATDELFTQRDLEQVPDLRGAREITVQSGEDVTLTEEGIYVLRGTASDTAILVDAEETATVQLVLDGVQITNPDRPILDIRSAEIVYVTTAADSTLSTTGRFRKDGNRKTNAVLFSERDLVLNGTASLNIDSTANGIICNKNLKITGGKYSITALSKTVGVKDTILILDGDFLLEAGSDGLHAEDKDDDTRGTIQILGGDFIIHADDDAIHADAAVTVDGGSFRISAGEGIESTCVRINSGEIRIEGSGDGINAGRKSPGQRPRIEITGGEITIVMSDGDTDGIDANGDIVITGGSIDITGSSAFDADGSIIFTGGTVIVNGQPLDRIPNQNAAGSI